MKKTHQSSFIVRISAKIGTCGIGAALWMSISACVPMGDRCRTITPASARVVTVLVDADIYVDDIYALGDCTDLVEGRGAVGYQEWKTEMTGRTGSTCTVYVTSGTNTREATTALEDDRFCGYPGADGIEFLKE